MASLPNPLIAGFHPDPSVVRVGADYYLATSSFEYLPGIPVFHSTDLADWTLIGHVASRPGQLQATGVPTGGGAWAPTIRWRDGIFYVVVTDAMGRGTLLFTADNPAGPWSDGTVIVGVDGIDPDLAWDDDGACYLTYSGLEIEDGVYGAHLGIVQARVDLGATRALEAPRRMWSGTGLMFPEAPHLYRVGEWWYLLIAEGGTERGHAVSIARSTSPTGPFEGCPANPVLSARSTARPIQCTGHGDLVQAPDGSWAIVLLGVRTRGFTRAFSALGRETFATNVGWVDGWPVMAPVELTPDVAPPSFTEDFGRGELGRGELGREWVGVRRLPGTVGRIVGGRLVLTGEGRTMDDAEPTFIGRRQRRLDARIVVRVEPLASGTVGGLTLRYDEENHYDIEIQPGRVVARARIATIVSETSAAIADGPVTLQIVMRAPSGNMATTMTCDLIELSAIDSAGNEHVLAQLDGRYLSAETACSFTGRVAGVYCVHGQLAVHRYEEVGS